MHKQLLWTDHERVLEAEGYRKLDDLLQCGDTAKHLNDMLSETLPCVPKLLADEHCASHELVSLLVCREALVISHLANFIGFVRVFRVQQNESPSVVAKG